MEEKFGKAYHKKYKEQYYQKNKDTILAKFKVKVQCCCGNVVNKYELPRHQKSTLHKKRMLLV